MVGVEAVARILGGVVLLFGNGFFVTAEFAMTRVPQFDEQAFQGHPGLERAWRMTDELEVYLSGCQVGITVCSVGLGVVAEPAVAALFGDLLHVVGVTSTAGHTAVSAALALALINLFHVVIGEQTPTYLGVERARGVAKYCSRPLYWWTTLMSPVIRFADWVAKRILSAFGVEMTRSWQEGDDEMTREELRAEMGATLSRGQLSDERREEVLNALAIGDQRVADIMVDREDIVALSADASIEENLATMRSHPEHTRFPLVEGEFDSFEGVVYAPRVLHHLEALEAGEESLASLATPPMVLTADTVVSDAIDSFQAENQELALVLEAGAVVGLLTATDALEAITGDIEDPMDKAIEDTR